MYADYHCNLACTYCLTESAPKSTQRIIGRERMLEIAGEAAELGCTDLGVTGGAEHPLSVNPTASGRVPHFIEAHRSPLPRPVHRRQHFVMVGRVAEPAHRVFDGHKWKEFR